MRLLIYLGRLKVEKGNILTKSDILRKIIDGNQLLISIYIYFVHSI